MNDCDMKILNLLDEWGNLSKIHVMILAKCMVKDIKNSLEYLLENGYIKVESRFNQDTFILAHKGYKSLGYTEVIRKRLSEKEFYSLEIFRFLFKENYVSLEDITVYDCKSSLMPSLIINKNGFKCGVFIYTKSVFEGAYTYSDPIINERIYTCHWMNFELASKTYRRQLWFITKQNMRMREILEKYAVERDVKIATFELEEILARI